MLGHIKLAVKDTFIYSLGNISTKLIGLVLLPLYTRELTIAEYGILGTIEITIQLLIATFSLSLSSALNRWYWDQQYRNKQDSIFFTTITTLVIFAGLMLLVFLPLAGKMSLILFDSRGYARLFKLLLFSAAFQVVSRGILSLMRLKRKPLWFTTTNIIKLLITLGLTIYLIVHLDRGLEGIIEAQIVGFISFILINLRFLSTNMAFVFEKKIFREMIIFSYPLAISSISSVLLIVADRYVVRYISGMGAMGLYSVAFKIANVLKVFVINSLSSALLPLKFQMMNQPRNREFYSKIMTYTVFGFIFFLLGLSLFSKEILRLMAQNPKYWIAYQIVPFLCFAQLFEMMRMNVNLGLIIQKKTRIISVILILVSILSIGLNILFVSLLGYKGAAISTILAQGIFFGLVYYYAQKHYYVPYELSRLVKLFVVSAVIIVISFTVLNPIQIIPRVILKFSLIILFPFILRFLKFYEAIELLRLRESWHKWKNPKNWKRNLNNIKFN